MDGENQENEPKVQADDNSIAVGKITTGRDIRGNIHIGDTKVYQRGRNHANTNSTPVTEKHPVKGCFFQHR
jgi:hypothetical protein